MRARTRRINYGSALAVQSVQNLIKIVMYCNTSKLVRFFVISSVRWTCLTQSFFSGEVLAGTEITRGVRGCGACGGHGGGGGVGGGGRGGIPNATLSPPERFFVKMGVAGSDILIRHVL